MSEKKRFRLGAAVVNVCSMPMPLAETVVDVATASLRDEMTEQDVASSMRKKLVERFPADVWQVFVGRNFSCFVSHEDGKYIYFYIGQTGFCVYSS